MRNVLDVVLAESLDNVVNTFDVMLEELKLSQDSKNPGAFFAALKVQVPHSRPAQCLARWPYGNTELLNLETRT